MSDNEVKIAKFEGKDKVRDAIAASDICALACQVVAESTINSISVTGIDQFFGTDFRYSEDLAEDLKVDGAIGFAGDTMGIGIRLAYEKRSEMASAHAKTSMIKTKGDDVWTGEFHGGETVMGGGKGMTDFASKTMDERDIIIVVAQYIDGPRGHEVTIYVCPPRETVNHNNRLTKWLAAAEIRQQIEAVIG